ncbi:hypothetical protein VTK73DRAFT_5610 [Phialemonium thermophilum]|uniref:Uncharacterized protein n=1 Tax=Phialemonium thermophilum TaxID=223376 RepID=A0ABR3V2I6_9PEZI
MMLIGPEKCVYTIVHKVGEDHASESLDTHGTLPLICPQGTSPSSYETPNASAASHPLNGPCSPSRSLESRQDVCHSKFACDILVEFDISVEFWRCVSLVKTIELRPRM